MLQFLLLLLLYVELYSYMPGTNHVSRAYNVAAFIQLQFMPHAILFPHVKCFELLHQDFQQYVCSSLYGTFM